MWGINRLTGIFSSSAISSKAISFSTISVLTTPRLPELEYITVIGLILFITFKEVLSESKIWEKDLDSQEGAKMINSFRERRLSIIFDWISV